MDTEFSDIKWITVINDDNYRRLGVKIRNIISGNDGDVGIAYITEMILKTKISPICVDIGVDQGWWTFFVNDTNENAKILSFEPNPISYSSLLTLIKNDPRITLYNIAISNHDGALPFVVSSGNSHSRNPDSTLSVKCKQIDSYIENKYIDIMKIDTEGHEIHILQSLRKHYHKIETIIFEFTSYWYKDIEEARQELLYILKVYPHVYYINRVGPPEYTDITKESLDEFMEINMTIQYDILATRLVFE